MSALQLSKYLVVYTFGYFLIFDILCIYIRYLCCEQAASDIEALGIVSAEQAIRSQNAASRADSVARSAQQRRDQAGALAAQAEEQRKEGARLAAEGRELEAESAMALAASLLEQSQVASAESAALLSEAAKHRAEAESAKAEATAAEQRLQSKRDLQSHVRKCAAPSCTFAPYIVCGVFVKSCFTFTKQYRLLTSFRLLCM